MRLDNDFCILSFQSLQDLDNKAGLEQKENLTKIIRSSGKREEGVHCVLLKQELEFETIFLNLFGALKDTIKAIRDKIIYL